MDPAPSIRRVAVPTDFSDPADLALATAIELARALGAELDLVHVTQSVMVLPPPLELISFPTLIPDLPARVMEQLELRAARVREAGLTVTTSTLEGVPHLEIVRHAEETGAGMVVMGTHGRGGLAHAVLGSVAERVLHKAHCPVLVVPVRRKD
jgi:universal stress protein A